MPGSAALPSGAATAPGSPCAGRAGARSIRRSGRQTCFIGLILAWATACAPSSNPDGVPPPWRAENFPNVLKLGPAPDSATDPRAYAFSDLGAWHMFGLPDPTSDSLPGAFPGPLLLALRGRWLSPAFVVPEVEVDGSPARLKWPSEADRAAVHFPGRLHQELFVDPDSSASPLGGESLQLTLDLVYGSPTATFIRAALANATADPHTVVLAWRGEDFYLPVSLRETDGTVRVELPGTEIALRVRSLMEGGESTVEHTGPPSYVIRDPPVRVGADSSASAFLLIEAPLDDLHLPGGAQPLAPPEAVFRQAEERWNGYLSRAVGIAAAAPATPPGRNEWIAVKAVETLVANWRTARGHLFHDGLFPSYAYRGFHGVWAWDSWKHARALALFAPELAKQQVRVMLDHQNDRGMVPDVIYVDSTQNNWRDTKPPLAAWAVEGIFRASADTAFVEEVFPALLACHRWWRKERDHDGNGLCEYGSTDGTRIAAAWESGMDNAVRFDRAGMVQNGPDAWSLDQESVDLNAYLYAEKGFLAELARAIGREGDAEALEAERDTLGAQIRELMFDDSTGYFYDVELETKVPVRVQGPEGWIPLWAGVASPEQASRVAKVLVDPGKFATFVPFPTLAADRPEFDPGEGYWRGPVWLDQAYFAVSGLMRYGFEEEARRLGERLLGNASGLSTGEPIHENYDPLTGGGLNAPHFSWSAAHLLLLLEALH